MKEYSDDVVVGKLLHPIQSSSSLTEQIRALETLTEQLRVLPSATTGAAAASREEEKVVDDDDDGENDNTGSVHHHDYDDDWRERLACGLLQDVVTVVGDRACEALVDCVLACGPLDALRAAVQTLKRIVAQQQGNFNKLESPHSALSFSLDVLKRILLLDHRRRQEGNSTTAWIDCMVDNNGSDHPVRTENDRSSSLGSGMMTAEVVDRVVSLALLLPSLIANACHAAESRFPSWAVQCKYYPRLVECSCRTAVLTAAAVVNGGQRDEQQRQKQLRSGSTQYFFSLVQTMIRNRGGKDVALALVQCYERIMRSSSSSSSGRDDDSSNREQEESNTAHPLLSSFRDLLLDVHVHQLTDRESAVLIGSLLRLRVQQQSASSSTGTAGTTVDWDAVWSDACLDLSCRPILRASSAVRDALIRRVVHSDTSILRERVLDRLICHGVASLLAGIEVRKHTTDQGEEGDDASSGDESGSDDDDDDDNGQAAEDTVLRRQLNEVSAVWSQTLFVPQTDGAMQRHVTCFLRSGLALLREEPAEEQEDSSSSRLTANLLAGVTERLHSTVPSVRKDGMLVGEALAKLLGQELRFDELEDGDRNDELVASTTSPPREEAVVQSSRASRTSLARKKRLARCTRRLMMDPDAEYVSDDDTTSNDDADANGNNHGASSDSDSDDEGDDSVWDDDDPLMPYDLEDDEQDLEETPRPLYLEECLEYLRTPDTAEHASSRQETALRHLPELVRARPANLGDVAPSLALELCRMDNKFNIENHSQMTLATLCALTVHEPLPVGRALIGQLFRDAALSDRLNILHTLQAAARELSGSERLEELAKTRRIETTQPLTGAARVAGKRCLTGTGATVGQGGALGTTTEPGNVMDTLEQRTRRWGQTRTTYRTPVAISNRFGGQVASVWFYTLVGNFMEKREESSLWGGSVGSSLLSKLFLTLTSIVEYSGNCPGTAVLAKDLLEIVWHFRSAQVPEVRSSVLYAVAASVGLLPSDAALGFVLTDSGAVLRSLQDIAAKDPDDTCRRLAMAICGNAAAAIESSTGYDLRLISG